MVYDNNHKISIVKSVILGYITRKYSRNIPIKQQCYLCDTSINGVIHRKEKRDKYDFIIYKSKDSSNKGVSSFCHEPISISVCCNNKYFCDTCSNYNENYIPECSICLNGIKNNIRTVCNHEFCYSCLMKWIKINNKEKKMFLAICPICKTKI